MRQSLTNRRDEACTSFLQGSVCAQDVVSRDGSRLLRVAARLYDSASAPTRETLKRSVAACAILLGASVLLSPTNAFALSVVGQFAFSQRFPGSAQHLGFPKGITLGVGAFVTPTPGVPVTECTATNLSSGVQLNLGSANIGILAGLYQAVPAPEFDADIHLGVWDIRCTDSDGTVVVVTTAPIDHPEPIPFVKRLTATGDPLAPSIAWDGIEAEDRPASCTMAYRVRLLIAATRQLFISSNLTTTSFVIPPSVIHAEDLDEIWVRIEALCNDTGGTDSRSNAFRPLRELLEEAN